jgi:hypothetical protein
LKKKKKKKKKKRRRRRRRTPDDGFCDPQHAVCFRYNIVVLTDILLM